MKSIANLRGKLKYRKLGKKGPLVSSLGFGCMVLTESYGASDKEAFGKIIRKAFDRGVTFFDTADCYGHGVNEELLGKEIQSFRKEIVIATKCGIEINPVDFSHRLIISRVISERLAKQAFNG